MCELLVRVVDKTNADPYVDANHCLKRGDVVSIHADGHEWGRGELGNPDWIIVKVPGVSVTDAAAFQASEVDDDPAHPSAVLQARAFRLNLDAKPVDLASLMAAKIRKPRLIDPNVIG